MWVKKQKYKRKAKKLWGITWKKKSKQINIFIAPIFDHLLSSLITLLSTIVHIT